MLYHKIIINYMVTFINTKTIRFKIIIKTFFIVLQQTYRIEKVIRRDDKKKMALVKWSGYPDKFNSC